MAVNTNERELSGKIAEWLSLELKNRQSKDILTNETSIKGMGSTTKFGDIVWWKGDRHKQEAFALIELKSPQGANENITTFQEKARTLNTEWALTWNFKELKIYSKNNDFKKPFSEESNILLRSIDQWTYPQNQAAIKDYLKKIADSLLNNDESQRGKILQPDKIFFIDLVNQTKDPLSAMYQEMLIEKSKQKQAESAIEKYAVEQGFVFPSKKEQYELLASHQVYTLLTKIIFYQTIRRFHVHLPDLRADYDNLSDSIRNAFARARQIDWQAVFEEGVLDELGIPESALVLLQNFLTKLEVYRFDQMPQDVVGELFEEIIPVEERHHLGQYFTKEDLTDFVIAFAVKDPSACYADPTCGSGTFLNRLYSRLKYLDAQKAHPELLNHIWGFDIGRFPAQLATLNLFRQKIDNFENFPRVRCINSFDVTPGSSFDFPPARIGKFQADKEQVDMPTFQALVGNFPFIRQELIEKKVTGFKLKLTQLIARQYFGSYNDLFETKNKKGLDYIQNQLDAAATPDERLKYIDLACKDGQIQLQLSGQADIYAYLYLHTSKWLTPDGRFAMITSNSYLDVAYGSVLKAFFADHFKIIAVIASWAEPWFEDAAVNTVITVLQKEPDPQKRSENHTAFVKLLKPLKEIIPHSLQEYDSVKRWDAYDHLVARIENAQYDKNKKSVANGIESLETPDFRLRLVKQELLQTELQTQKDQNKWGKYLRAPDVYFEILDKCKDKLVPLKQVAEVRFGIKTGINDFFYLQKVEETNPTKSTTKDAEHAPTHHAEEYEPAPLGTIRITNTKGYNGFIEEEYLKRVIKSPKESETIRINPDKLKNLLFVCPKAKDELRSLRHFHALAYIEWGEKQLTKEGVKWTDVPSVSGRKNWWFIDQKEICDFIWPKAFNERFFVTINQEFPVADRLYEVTLYDDSLKHEILALLLNSTFQYLFIEINGRVNLGEGALDNMTYEAGECLTVNIQNLEIKLDKEHFKLLNRVVLPVYNEVKQKDRQALDKAVLEALGLDPALYQKRIYDGLCKLVSERIELPKMRKKKQKQKVSVAVQDVKASVLKEILPYGVPHFPDYFYKPTAHTLEYRLLSFEAVESSGKKLFAEYFMGNYIVKDEINQEIYQTLDPYKARFFTLLPIHKLYQIPVDSEAIKQIVLDFDIYIEELRSKLLNDARRKTHNSTQAERLTQDILTDLGLSEPAPPKKTKKK